MSSISEVLQSQYLDASEFVRAAVAGLGDHPDLDTSVVDIGLGWLRRGEVEPAELVDTVFVLTNTQLGIGQTSPGIGDPRWIPLSAVIGVDAVDGTPFPLQTLELELAGGLMMCVGWDDRFIQQVIAVLSGEEPMPTAAQELADRYTQDAAPSELMDSSLIDDDPSALDLLDPPLVEPTVVDEFFGSGNEEAISAHDATMTGGDECSLDEYFSGPTMDQEEAYGEAADLFFEPDEELWTDDDQVAPWMTGGIRWPVPLKPVNFLGGAPGAPKKRKGGIMVISRQGIDVTGTKMSSWEMHHDWSQVEGFEVFTPDEARFMFNAKVDKGSSVIQLILVEGQELHFEVRGAPAANLRTSLGSVIAMARGLKRWRVVREQR